MFEAGRIDMLDYDYEETNIFQDPSSSTDYRYVRSEFEKSGITVEPDEDIAVYLIPGRPMLFYGIFKNDESVEDMIIRTACKYMRNNVIEKLPFMTGVESIPVNEIKEISEELDDNNDNKILLMGGNPVIWAICDGILFTIPENFQTIGILEKY